jgi:hypothetical protein
MVSDKRCTEVLKYAEEHGAAEACKTFGLNPVTLNRYRVKLDEGAPGTSGTKGEVQRWRT